MTRNQKIDKAIRKILNEYNIKDSDAHAFDEMVENAISKSREFIKGDYLSIKICVLAYSYYLYENGIAPVQIINQKKLQRVFTLTLERFIRDFHQELNSTQFRKLLADKEIENLLLEFNGKKNLEDFEKLGALMNKAIDSKKFLGEHWDNEMQEKVLGKMKKIIQNHIK